MMTSNTSPDITPPTTPNNRMLHTCPTVTYYRRVEVKPTTLVDTTADHRFSFRRAAGLPQNYSHDGTVTSPAMQYDAACSYPSTVLTVADDDELLAAHDDKDMLNDWASTNSILTHMCALVLVLTVVFTGLVCALVYINRGGASSSSLIQDLQLQTRSSVPQLSYVPSIINNPPELQHLEDMRVDATITLVGKQQQPAAVPPRTKRNEDLKYWYGLDQPLFNQSINSTTLEKIDVVYSWVDGSETLFLDQLQQYSQQHSDQYQDPNSAVPKSPINYHNTDSRRFRNTRDEFRYSVRSLMMHMPWFNRLYIVTNGQVPRWLNTSNPRVNIVPHSSIFPDKSHLPTFSSAAIESHLHRIPGLSPNFIYMNDDFFLLKQHTIRDFVNTDTGAEVTYASWQFTTCRTTVSANNPYPDHACLPSQSTYESMLRRQDDMMVTQYDPRPHPAIAHYPYFYQKDVISAAEQQYGDMWRSTSASRFRHHDDLQLKHLYQHYLIHTHHSYELAPSKDIHYYSLTEPGYRRMEGELHRIWYQQKFKMVCLNDDLNDDNNSIVGQINNVVKAHLSNMYPTASEFELPLHEENQCSEWVQPEFGQLPTAEQIQSACKVVTVSR